MKYVFFNPDSEHKKSPFKIIFFGYFIIGKCYGYYHIALEIITTDDTINNMEHTQNDEGLSHLFWNKDEHSVAWRVAKSASDKSSF